MEHMYKTQYRNMGKMFQQFVQFITYCRAGKRIQLHGHDYVAIDRKSWDEIQAKLRKANLVTKTFFDEDLTK